MRSIADIYNAIIAKKSTINTLNTLGEPNDSFDKFQDQLNSTSKVSIWRLYVYLIAIAHYVQEQFFETFKEEVKTLLEQAPVGTPAWYRQQVLNFQLGDSLQYIDQNFQYAQLDSTKQIVKLCTVTDRNDSVLLIKAAKNDTAGNPIPLSATEKTALEGYISQVRFAGTRFRVVSDPADSLKLSATVYYNPIIPQQQVQVAVEAAIDNYIANLPFDGQLRLSALVDAVQNVEGVTDFTIASAQSKYGALAYTTITRISVANAGYFEIDPLHPLSSTIVYSASL